jgi:hypothetical protein
MNICIYCGGPTKGRVCGSKACQNKKKNQHRLDNLPRYRELAREERKRNFPGRRASALVRAKKRYYSDNLDSVAALMFQHAKSRNKTHGLDFDIDKEYLLSLFERQNNECALTGIKFQYDIGDDSLDLTHKRPFAPSLDRIDSKRGYTKDNVRIVCVIVNFALCEFGDQVFDQMCEAYVNRKRVA